ncbi:MAG: transglycosylase SLT domain-containing protein [Candidatus Rokuibacteriota bacterium]
MRPWAALLAAGSLLATGSPAGAQVYRIEDDAGVVHFTNEPCHPKYVRLAPAACPAPPAAGTPAGAVGFSKAIETAATRYGVDRRLVQAVVEVESGGDPRAVSPKGALGLMQLMPARAEALGVTDAFDPGANLDGGVRHLRDLLARYDGNLRLALAAYNAGEDAVRVHGGIPPFRETQEYVRKVLTLYEGTTAPPGPKASPRRGL